MSEDRTAVYTSREKLLLTQLVKENFIIENKRTDGATVAEKNRAWEILTTTYNSQPEVDTPRTQQQLRKLWNNLKQRKRKETTALRHDMLATGGGPPNIPDLDPVLEFVSEAAASLDVDVDCPFDSTHLFEKGDCPAEPVWSRETSESLFLGNSSLKPVPSTSKGTTGEHLCNYSMMKPATPAVLQSTNSLCLSATTPKGVETKKAKVPDEKVRTSRLIETSNQVEELHNLKRQIAEEELLRVKEERRRAAQNSELLREVAVLKHQKAVLEHQKAVLEHQRAADEAELASLKLKKFKKEMLSEDDKL